MRFLRGRTRRAKGEALESRLSSIRTARWDIQEGNLWKSYWYVNESHSKTLSNDGKQTQRRRAGEEILGRDPVVPVGGRLDH